MNEPTSSIAGKTVLVTGANGGLGKAVVQSLAKQGAHVVMACRSEDRGRPALEEIAQEVGADKLSLMTVDLSSQKSIRDFAAAFLDEHDKLDVLINNAAVQSNTRKLSVDNIEQVFATNVLAYQLLTKLLFDRLESSAPARVVNVASSFASSLDVEDLQFERRAFKSVAAYKQSKQANRMLTWEWARRHADSGVTFNAMTPGMMDTGLFREVKGVGKLVMKLLIKMIGATVEQGADTAIWLASSNEPEAVNSNGKFYHKRKAQPCKFADLEAQKRLWDKCEELLRGSL